MNNASRDKHQKSYILARTIYDLTMALIFIVISVVMLFPNLIKSLQFINLNQTFKYFFGTLCLLYGAFRLYRGIKRDY